MIQQTLLEIVQDLLASVEDDEVNSITDVESSVRAANIVKQNFYEIVAAGDLPEHYDFFELETTSDPTKPTLMTMPTNVGSISWVKYNNSVEDTVEFKRVTFLSLDTFIERMYNLSETDADVTHFTHTISGSTIDFLVKNNLAPQFYTTFDDRTVVFDSFNSDEDTFLVKNKTLCYGQILPVFVMEDDFILPLDQKQYALLLHESKRQLFNEFRQSDNPLSAQKARRAWIRLQRDKRAIPFPHNYYNDYPNYGRKR